MTDKRNGYYDLSKPEDYAAYVELVGPKIAKATRFALAYGVKYTGHTQRDLHAFLLTNSESYAKLEAAFASQMRKR